MQHRQRAGILPPSRHLNSTDLLRAQVCNTKYDTVQEQECTTVQEQECTTVNEQQCSTVNEQVKPYLFYLKLFSTSSSQVCNTVQEQECNTVNEQQCRTVQDTVNEQVKLSHKQKCPIYIWL